MNEISLHGIGTIILTKEAVTILLHPSYRKGLQGIEEYSHANLLWWCDGCDDPLSRQTIVTSTPYTSKEMGIFATRSPQRPNPIALTTAEILHVDINKGLLVVSWIDAENGSPVLDIKPYIPSLDRVAIPVTPSYLAHWPKSLEASADFDWSAIFAH